MNERIRELAREAGLVAPYGSDHEGLRDFDYSKFAKLIVRECVDIVESHRMKMDSGITYIIKDLKEHFGVEE